MLARSLRAFAGKDGDAEGRRERVARASGIDHLGRGRGDASPAHDASGRAKLDRRDGARLSNATGIASASAAVANRMSGLIRASSDIIRAGP